jgi:Mg/Co/Ni transporter MgtE
VYDLIGGRASWTVLGLPTEGSVADRDRISSVVRRPPTVSIGATVRAIVALGPPSDDTIAVVDENGVLLGALDSGVVELPLDTAVERIMMPAPSTIRPDLRIDEVVKRLHNDHLDHIFVTAVNGTLFGIATLEELDAG